MKIAVFTIQDYTDTKQSKVIVRPFDANPYARLACGDIEFDAAAARELAATLVKAADQIDHPLPAPTDLVDEGVVAI